MKRVMQSLILTALALLVTAVATLAQARPQCTGRGWYLRADSTAQYPVWDYTDPSKAGQWFQGLGAHSRVTYGGDGVQYAILDQCHADQGCTGLVGTYRRPADPIAGADWDHFYTAPDAQARRQSFGYYNAAFQIPTGLQSYVLHTLAELPPGFQYSLGTAYGCPNITPLPTGTKAPTVNALTRTPTKRPPPPTVNPCAVLPGGICPPTAAAPTRTKTSVPIPATQPPAPTSAPAPPTVAPPKPTAIPPTPAPAPTKASGGWFTGCRVAPQPTPAP